MAIITYSKAINQALEEELRRDEDVILYGQDVAEWGGIFKVTDGLFEKFGPDRVTKNSDPSGQSGHVL